MAVDTEEKNVISEMLQRAPEPGDIMGAGRVISDGKAEDSFPTIASSLISPGHLLLYHTETGEASVVREDLLGHHLSKRLPGPGGGPAFTITPPKTPPVRGSLMCLLHKDHPERQRNVRLGIPSCPKANLVTLFDVEQHMKARPKKEWATLEAERQRREREEDRTAQRGMMKGLAVLAAQGKPGRKPKTNSQGE